MTLANEDVAHGADDEPTRSKIHQRNASASPDPTSARSRRRWTEAGGVDTLGPSSLQPHHPLAEG